MRSIGIICEYNPFHKGHARQLRLARELAGEDCALVCLMSGNYVQRGEPAIFPKAIRAEAALRCGADLVLELPLTAALSSAEGFAAGGVEILSALGCDYLCFGTETDDNHLIMSIARANLDPAFDALLRAELATGCSYPAARQHVLEQLVGAELEESRMYAHIGPEREAKPVPTVGALSKRPQGLPPAGTASRPEAVTEEPVLQLSVLSRPNDLLAVEYCKAILKQGSPLRPLPVRRTGSYHATELDLENPSATAIRAAIERDCADKQCLSLQARFEACHSERSEESGSPVSASAWRSAVPDCLRDLYASAPIHTMRHGERAVLSILRTLPDAAFEALPFGAEGLWSKFMKNCRRCASAEEIIEATKSKRYTRTRIQRMLLCAVLGLTAEDLAAPAPYARILGFSDLGRVLLRGMKPRFPLVNAGERPADGAYYALECRAAELYSLFSAEGPRPGGEEARQRVRFFGAPDEAQNESRGSTKDPNPELQTGCATD